MNNDEPTADDAEDVIKKMKRQLEAAYRGAQAKQGLTLPSIASTDIGDRLYYDFRSPVARERERQGDEKFARDAFGDHYEAGNAAVAQLRRGEDPQAVIRALVRSVQLRTVRSLSDAWTAVVESYENGSDLQRDLVLLAEIRGKRS